MIERELKLSAPESFVMPDLSGVVGGATAVAQPGQELASTYFDTDDLRLLRRGLSLRFRAGDGSGWTIKLPEGEDGPALVRRELSFPGSDGEVPDEAADVVRGYTRGAPLHPVAHLRTRRDGVALVDESGNRLAEVVHDKVEVLDSDRVVGRFAEVEVELGPGAPPRLLARVGRVLAAAGAASNGNVPKVAAALGQPKPDDRGPTLGRRSPATDAVRAAIADGLTRVLRHDPGVRVGDDPEDVHQARVAARRLRSHLRTLRPVLEAEPAVRLRAELKWLADALGAVRDADVLLERLRRQSERVPDRDASAVAGLLRRLAAEREDARTALLNVMREDRYLGLLADLEAAVEQPPVSGVDDLRAGDLWRERVRASWRRVRRAVPEEVSPESLHALRIECKRCRYASEEASRVWGRPARRLARAVARVQQVLGDHQDAVVAEAWLRDAAESDPSVSLAAGELIVIEREEADDARKRWRRAWRRASKPSLRRWL